MDARSMQITETAERLSDRGSWDSRDENTVMNTDDTLVPGRSASMSSKERDWRSPAEKTTVDTTDDDRITLSKEEAWRVTHQELNRCEAVAGHLEHFIVGGELVRRLNGAGKHIIATSDGRYRPEEYCTSWIWDALQTKLDELVYSLIETTLKSAQEAEFPRAGIILVMDTPMIEEEPLEDLEKMLFNIRKRVDEHNKTHGTNYYLMLALCLYPEEQKYQHSDAQIASVNAMFCTFNSFLGRRATLDLNRHLLDREEGRFLSIRGEKDWRVNPNKFENGDWSKDTLFAWYEYLMDFISEDDGMRCKYDDLTFPFKTNKKGVISFLPNFRVSSRIRHNVCNIDVRSIEDPEQLYWLRFKLLQEGKHETQVPALPSLNLRRYTFSPKEPEQVTAECQELDGLELSPRASRRATRRRERAEQREDRRKIRRYQRSLLQMVTRGRLDTDGTEDTEDKTDVE